MTLALAALAIVLTATGLWFRRMARVQIPADRRGFVVAWAVGALLAATALILGSGFLTVVPAVIALVGGLFLCFTVSISAQAVAANAVREGEEFRAFTALDDAGATFELASTAGKPVLLKFFRGHW